MEKEQTKKMEKISQKEFEVTDIDVETNRYNVGEVQKIRFKTSVGDITWKPKMTKEEYRGGVKIIKTVPCEVDMLPDRVKELGSLLQNKGKFKICGDYMKMAVDNDGETIFYRFILSEKTLNDWKVIQEKEEKIEG